MITWDRAQQLVRIAVQIGAGALVQRGYINDDMAVAGTGAALTLIGIAWWAVWDRKRTA